MSKLKNESKNEDDDQAWIDIQKPLYESMIIAQDRLKCSEAERLTREKSRREKLDLILGADSDNVINNLIRESIKLPVVKVTFKKVCKVRQVPIYNLHDLLNSKGKPLTPTQKKIIVAIREVVKKNNIAYKKVLMPMIKMDADSTFNEAVAVLKESGIVDNENRLGYYLLVDVVGDIKLTP